MMYNEEQKLEFINSLEDDDLLKNTIVIIFEESEEMEKALNKDLCDFSIENICEFYKMRFTHSANTLLNINSRINRYSSWCLNHNLINDNQNHYLNITYDIISKCINKNLIKNTYIKRDELLDLCKEMPNSNYKVVVLGIFEGIYDKRLESLRYATKENINGNVFTMKNGKQITISDELKREMLECLELTDSIVCFGNVEKKIVDSNYILKKTTTRDTDDVVSYSCLKYWLLQCQEKFECNVFNVMNLKISGRLHEINKLIIKNNITDLSEISNYYKELADIGAQYSAKYMDIYKEIY